MHKYAKEMADCVVTKSKAIGFDNIEGEQLDELVKWSKAINNFMDADYKYHIVCEMEKPENKYGENYDENGKFYTRMRNAEGQYMSRGRRRGYDEMYDPNEHYRDMDYDMGRMYYTEPNMGNMGMSGMNSNGNNSRYESAKRGYEESKQMNPNDDSKNMEKLEELFKTFEEDINKLKPKMTTNEKNFGRTKLESISSMMH